MTGNYITSERFIVDDLLLRAEAIAERVRARWKKGEPVTGHCIVWPAEGVMTDEGQRVQGPLACALPGGHDQQRVLREIVEKGKAYALVLVEKREQALVVLFESHLGTRMWKMPLRRQGDVLVLQPTEVSNNVEGLGLLWSPTSGSG